MTFKKMITSTVVCCLLIGQIAAQIFQNDKVTIGLRDSLHSKTFEEQRDFYIYIPEAAPDEKFPVVFTLDGQEFFVSAVGMVHNLSEVWGGGFMPKMIVVGIPNPKRMYDLTPSVEKKSNGEPAPYPTGGGTQFLEYLENELIPFIENKYPAQPYRTYIGHSLGGLAVLQALLEKPHLFNNYIALDPSLWWDDQFLLKKYQSNFGELDLKGRSLYVGMANTLPYGMNIDSVRTSTSRDLNVLHPRSIWELNNKVIPNAGSNLRFNSNYYENDSHVSVVYIAQLHAFRWLFDWYDNKEELMSFAYSDIAPAKAVKAYVDHYEMVSANLGYVVLPPAGFLEGYSKFLFGKGKTETALAFLKLNAQNYPENPKTHEALGWFYEQNQAIKKAIEAYEKAVEKGGGIVAQEKIENLRARLDD